MLWEWAAAAAAVIVAVLFCLRLTRQGLGTLEEERDRCLERIREMEEQVREDQKNMPSGEHLRIVHAALEDLLRQAGAPTEDGLLVEMDAAGQCLVWRLPGPDGRPEEWRVRRLCGNANCAAPTKWPTARPAGGSADRAWKRILRTWSSSCAPATAVWHSAPARPTCRRSRGRNCRTRSGREPPHLARRLARPGTRRRRNAPPGRRPIPRSRPCRRSGEASRNKDVGGTLCRLGAAPARRRLARCLWKEILGIGARGTAVHGSTPHRTKNFASLP